MSRQQQKNWKTSHRRTKGRYNHHEKSLTLDSGLVSTLGIISESSNSRSSAFVSTDQQEGGGEQESGGAESTRDRQQEGNGDAGNVQNSTADIFQIIEQDGINSQQQNHPNKTSNASAIRAPPQDAFQNRHLSHEHENVHKEDHDDEDDGPVIYTNQNCDDDDAISQITSSIAGNSIYSHDYMFASPTVNVLPPPVPASSTDFLKNNDEPLVHHKEQPYYASSSSLIQSEDKICSGDDGKESNVDSNDQSRGGNVIEEKKDELSDVSSKHGNTSESKSITVDIPHQTNDQSEQDIASSALPSVKYTGEKAIMSAVNDDVDDDVFQNDDDVVNIYATQFLGRDDNNNETFANGPNNGMIDDDLTMQDMYSTAGSSLGTVKTMNTRQESLHYQKYQYNNNFGSNFNNNNNDGGIWNEDSLSGTISRIDKGVQTRIFRLKRLFFNTTQHSRHKKDDDDRSNNSSSNTSNHEMNNEMDYLEMILSPLNSTSGGSSQSINSSGRIHKKQKGAKKRTLVILFQIIGLVSFLWFLLLLIKFGNDEALRKRQETFLQEKGNAKQKQLLLSEDISGVRVADSSVGLLRGEQQNQHNTLPDSNHVENQEHIIESDALQASSSTITSQMNNDEMALPIVLRNFADLTDSVFNPATDIPFFWHIPRSAGASMNDILGECYQLRLASNAGGMGGHNLDNSLQVLEFENSHITYVNVDVSDNTGIERAINLGLATSGLVDVVMSSLLHESAHIFDPMHRGRMFTFLRHPVERATSLFYFLQETHWKNPRTYDKDLADISIENYFRNSWRGESNWQVRFLTNQITKGQVDENDLKLAMEILRRKCLVGLLSEKVVSLQRFERYFGWKVDYQVGTECIDEKLQINWPLRHDHNQVEEGTELWNMIVSHNVYDMRLYEYAQQLFKEQVILIH